MSNEFNLPDVGEGLTEADIVSWKVAPGDTVTVNQILVEIETAKSLVELPSPQAGTIEAILVEEGETVEVGTPIIRFGGAQGAATPDTAKDVDPTQPAGDEESGPNLVGYGTKASSTKRRPRKGGAAPAAATSAAPATPAPAQEAPAATPSASAETRTSTPDKPLAKPPVRKLAKDRGIDLGDVTPTGPNGQITRDDVLNHGTTSAQGAAENPAQATTPVGSGALDGTEERIPFKGVVKFMAQAMVDSAFTAPHVTEFVDVDVTETMNLVRKFKANETLGEGVKVSPLLILSKAVCWAVARNPRINSALDGDSIVVKKYVNLGIAAATPRGLIVPNIKNAHAMGLSQLATELGELTRTARAGKTTPAAQAGGTISITNIGVFGIDTGTPIINPGEAAILAFGQVRKRPWVVGDDIVPREITTLAVSADHRVVDGEVISKFLADVARVMEDPTLLMV